MKFSRIVRRIVPGLALLTWFATPIVAQAKPSAAPSSQKADKHAKKNHHPQKPKTAPKSK